MALDELSAWVASVPDAVPSEVRDMARAIVGEMAEPMRRLQQLGLGYLSLDRASSSLSTGERQRVQLARAVRGRTTGALYVLDEPSIGLHPSNVDGLLGVVDDLLADGNSVLLVDHDVRVLRHADHLVEIGPGSGANGGCVIAQGSPSELVGCPRSRRGAFRARPTRARAQSRGKGDHVRPWLHRAFDGQDAHGQAAFGAHSSWTPCGGDGCFRLGEDHAGSRGACARVARGRRRRGNAEACKES